VPIISKGSETQKAIENAAGETSQAKDNYRNLYDESIRPKNVTTLDKGDRQERENEPDNVIVPSKNVEFTDVCKIFLDLHFSNI